LWPHDLVDGPAERLQNKIGVGKASKLIRKSSNDSIKSTREAAIAIFEDFAILQSVCDQVETRPVDLRHASAILRRWLVEGQLGRVANPRVGRLQLMAIDNNPVYRAERRGGVAAFVSGGATIHGVYLAAATMNEGGRAVNFVDYHPDTLIALTLKTFLTQRVIYSSGEWSTRQQVIKFVANADHGVHGHGAREDWEQRLSEFRQEVSVCLVDGPDGMPMPSFGWNVGSHAGDMSPADYDPSRVNGVLLELLSTMFFLVKSPDVVRLMASIEAEIA
jgi:hypothetical protein